MLGSPHSGVYPMGCHPLRTSAKVTAFSSLLHQKLVYLTGCEDLHVEDLHRLHRQDVAAGLRKLSPFITTFCNLAETLPENRPEGEMRVGLVFGSNFWEPVVGRAAELYAAGAVTHFIVSGHQSKRLTQPEGVLMRQHLIRKGGVPHHCILIDTKATNTGENAENVVRIYTENFWRVHFPPVLLVAKNYHTLRAFTALHERLIHELGADRLPEMFLGTSQLPTHQGDTWLDDPQSVEQIVGEVYRFRRYHREPVRVSCADRLRVESLLPELQTLTL